MGGGPLTSSEVGDGSGGSPSSITGGTVPRLRRRREQPVLSHGIDSNKMEVATTLVSTPPALTAVTDVFLLLTVDCSYQISKLYSS